MPKTIQNCKLKAWGSKSLFNLSYMGATHSKATPPTIPTNSLKQHVTVNSECVCRAISIYIHNEAGKRNIDLPSDIITLCIKHIPFVMTNTILTVEEEIELFEHLRSKIILERSMKLMYCHLLYEHKSIAPSPFDMETFVKILQNKSNILIIFWTQFNHVISLFINQSIHQRIVDCKMFALLLRSQFVTCQCPKELLFAISHLSWDIQRAVSPGVTFGALALYENPKSIEVSMDSPDITNIDGNEVFGGTAYTKGDQYCDVKLKRIQIYQMFC
eukprot:255519_1